MIDLEPQWICHSFPLNFIFIFSLSLLLDSKFLAKEFWLNYDYMPSSGLVTRGRVPTNTAAWGTISVCKKHLFLGNHCELYREFQHFLSSNILGVEV